MLDISIIVPFYNPPIKYFIKCLEYLKRLHVKEVILVDDCSSDHSITALAKQSGFIYLKTPYQSGHDGLPFNLGVQYAKGTYVCKVDADDYLLELTTPLNYDFHLARLTRSADPTGINIEKLILAPRSIHNGAIIAKELMLETPFEKNSVYFNDVLAIMRLLYRGYTFSVHPKINYIYNKVDTSIQMKNPVEYHRLRNVQTVARFAQLENIPIPKAEYYLKLAMLNLRYGARSLQVLNSKKRVKA